MAANSQSISVERVINGGTKCTPALRCISAICISAYLHAVAQCILWPRKVQLALLKSAMSYAYEKLKPLSRCPTLEQPATSTHLVCNALAP